MKGIEVDEMPFQPEIHLDIYSICSFRITFKGVFRDQGAIGQGKE